MDSGGSRAQSFKPEGGLSEWASKVKNMHSQVDPNEEADQKRLEDEIAASRLARLRRSQISGGRTNSLDLSKHKEYSSALRDTTSADEPKPLEGRQEALNKLMGSSSPPVAKEQPPVASTRPEPISLAAFIGGRATGPRLNKHAPQQDGSDPTQFVQRTRTDAPHPIFGRGGIGGIAMPGMAAKSSAPPEPDPAPAPAWSRPGRTPEPRDRRRSTPSPEKLESPPASPQKASVRERTMSTPTGPKNGPIFSPQPTRDTTENRSNSTTSHSNGFGAPGTSRALTSGQSTPASSPPSKSPVVTPSLSRPIQPDPRTSPQGPQISMSQSPSLAFLRPPPQKDPTPSLSRLKGRGFVQNMVKVSSQLESPAPPSPSIERPRSTSGRKPSVLDRWPSPAPAASPPPSPTAAPMRRSRTVDTPATTAPSSARAVPISKSYSDTGKAKVDEPSSSVKPTPGLGSASTIVLPPKAPGVDELGFKRRDDPLPRPSKTSALPEPLSKPLIHPTKDRAKKPKKNRTSGSEHEGNPPPPSSSVVSTPSAPTPTPPPSSRNDLIHSRPLPAMSPSQSIVSSKPSAAPEPTLPVSGSNGGGSGMVGRRALPGMAQPSISPKPSHSLWETEPEPTPSVAGSNGGGSGMVGRRALPGMAQPSVSPKPSHSLWETEPEPTPPVAGSNGGGSGMVGRRALPGMAQPSISPKPSHSLWDNPEPTPPVAGSNGGTSGMVGRRALPGMTQPQAIPPPISPKPSNLVPQAEPVPAPRALPGLASAIPPNFSQPDNISSFGVHSRLPSAGRPTVMDMAQALADPPRKLSPTPPAPPPVDDEPAELPAARPRNVPSAPSQNRRSSYDRYSMVLPPLKEEATPDPTPVSTLTRAVGNAFAQPDFDLVGLRLRDHGEDAEEVIEEIPKPKKAEEEIIRFTHADDPLPRFDVSPLLKYSPPGPSKDSQTIQVDVMAIAGSTAFPLGLTCTFYDTEILAIIHRSKSSSTGLISSTVWSWQGKSSSIGESEERKLTELAKRYGTSIVPIRQLSEPVELVQCLGGTLSIRQGSRAHWADDNTALHIVRSLDGAIFIDQVDIGIKNLCSGFSYCVSILSTVYVWHGRGSTPVERTAAVEYAKTLTSNPDEISVLIENEGDDDEMFWMVLGDDAEYAKADYWRWRPSVGFTPRIWSVDSSRKNAISAVQSFRQETAPHGSVYILDCVFEFFVLIPSGARGKRRDIRLALAAAMDAADRLASARPYTPTVHALILPSQLPIDLRVQFRDLEEVFLDDADVPDHMNILSSRGAQTQLQTSSWTKSQLKDKSMLPLGLDESHVS